MYAIFEAKGKQFRAEPDVLLQVPSLDAEPGDRVTFDHVLLAQRGDEVIVGQPALDGAAVAAEVVRHGRGDKIIVYKMKRRKGYRRKQGHRQGFTEIRVLDIEFGSGETRTRPAKAATPAPEKKSAPKAKTEPKPEAKKAAAEAADVLATDTAVKLASEAGIDLAAIEGTGKDGRILKSDVQKAIKDRDEA